MSGNGEGRNVAPGLTVLAEYLAYAVRALAALTGKPVQAAGVMTAALHLGLELAEREPELAKRLREEGEHISAASKDEEGWQDLIEKVWEAVEAG